MASFPDRFATKRKSLNDGYDIMDSSDSSKRMRTQLDSGMDEVGPAEQLHGVAMSVA